MSGLCGENLGEAAGIAGTPLVKFIKAVDTEIADRKREIGALTDELNRLQRRRERVVDDLRRRQRVLARLESSAGTGCAAAHPTMATAITASADMGRQILAAVRVAAPCLIRSPADSHPRLVAVLAGTAPAAVAGQSMQVYMEYRDLVVYGIHRPSIPGRRARDQSALTVSNRGALLIDEIERHRHRVSFRPPQIIGNVFVDRLLTSTIGGRSAHPPTSGPVTDKASGQQSTTIFS